MKLTGNALAKFTMQYGTINHLPEYCQNTLIINWFDSIPYIANQSCWEYLFYQEYKRTRFLDYKKATLATIKKANEIFNLNNNL